MLAFLSSLPISVLRILDTEANKFYDRSNQLYDAALLTRDYTQHALRPYIDSEINHKRHYIKVSFISRGMDFICLFVCVEVLRPSQPNGVMSSVVSLPNHTFTGQA